jgi:predicted N-acetyltransferase YhbS
MPSPPLQSVVSHAAIDAAIDQVIVAPVTEADLPAIFDLNARIFGPGRFARTAYRIREGAPLISRFCLKAVQTGGRSGDQLIAAIRFTEVRIGGQPGGLLLGPLAVENGFAGLGFGRRLIADGLDAARTAGLGLCVLVGDQPYYGRFGFVVVPPGQIRLPGPADPGRMLAAELRPGGFSQYRGMVSCA